MKSIQITALSVALSLALVGCAAETEENGVESEIIGQDPNETEVDGSENGEANEADDTGTNESQGFIDIIESRDVAGGLNIPWSIVHHEDIFYLTEREGVIAKVENGEVTREELDVTEEVLHYGEGGLLGFVLDPNFADNAKAYLYYTYGTEAEALNRVIEVEHREGTWVETAILIDEIKGAQFHHGGRLAIGPDDKLYITTGDALEESLSQDLNDVAGKILRLEFDGSIPEDNPDPSSPIYSYGHRNPQGLAWDEEGQLFSSEHGPSAHDEINRIEPGLNYGWPEIMGDETADGMEVALYHSGNDTWAPSGMVYLDGHLYVAALRGSMVIGFDTNGGQSEVIWEGEGRIRDIFVEGNSLYIITNNTDGRGMPGPEDDRLIELIFE
ncbi:PQQ-dependent sugar dehydrogenase [Bacillus horti]|uniref:Glucose/arabinose dehydrogenase n=1 Tax=Caldalkalibacillus horti TaxID=77523 RepID=A0ABT9VXV0_9BACI|nr:PQQ-dependent sugar dehydrogenase [Bacillus horti]MDQ0165817.1 glucose/arabinose dehydrogenase [Bacillus horti]